MQKEYTTTENTNLHSSMDRLETPPAFAPPPLAKRFTFQYG